MAGLSVGIAMQVAVLYATRMNTLFHAVPLAHGSLLPPVVLAAVPWAEALRRLVVPWRLSSR